MRKNFYQKFILPAAAALMASCILTGCTSTQSGNLNNGSGAQGTAGGSQISQSAEGSGDQVLVPSGDGSGSIASASQASGSQASGQAVSGQDVSGQNTASQTADGQNAVSASGDEQEQTNIPTYDSINQSGEDVPGQVYDADNDDVMGRDELTGTYQKADESESVSISLDNDTLASFEFAVCGIHGDASVTGGTTAVYSGDDGYTITFAISGDVLTVTVGGEDAETSPINGTYLRMAETEEAESEYSE